MKTTTRLRNLNGLASKRKVPLKVLFEKAAPYYFDRNAALRAIRFFETQLYHIEGELAGNLLKLERWERRIIWRTFGWKHREGEQAGTRVVRELYIEVPRKNGKSFLASGFALYLTFADKEPGSQVISAAGDTDQAAVVYDVAKRMVLSNPVLSKLVGTPYRRSMAVFKTASSFKVISSEGKTKHGKNLHGGIVDELHIQPDRELVDVLLTSTSSRRQPLMVYITTAGFDRNSICWEKHEYAKAIIDEEFEDHSFFGIIFAAEDEDDWTSEEIWYKANPNLGISKQLSYMRKECNKAKNSPAYENTFRRLELDQWTEQAERWIPMHLWNACNFPVDQGALLKRECFLGVDLSSTTDLCSVVAIFPFDTGQTEDVDIGAEGEEEIVTRKIMTYSVLPYFWVPEDNLHLRSKKSEMLFRKWIKEGTLIASPGAVCDYDRIRRHIGKLNEKFNVREIAIDRWNATQLSTQLDGDGFTVVPFGQGYGSMSAPSKTLLELVLSKRIAHGGHPVLGWCAGNVAIETDAAGNIKPSKKKSPEKIDGIVATVNALGRVNVWKDDNTVYEERGILSI